MSDPSLVPEPSLAIEPWRSLSELALAAHQHDAEGFLATSRQMSQLLSLKQAQTASLYLGYLLRGAVRLSLRHSPNPEELQELAESIHPTVAVSLHIDADAIMRTLLTAHELAPDNQIVTGGDFIIFGAAALGALLRKPESDLATLRASLARWAAKHDAEINQILEGDK